MNQSNCVAHVAAARYVDNLISFLNRTVSMRLLPLAMKLLELTTVANLSKHYISPISKSSRACLEYRMKWFIR